MGAEHGHDHTSGKMLTLACTGFWTACPRARTPVWLPSRPSWSSRPAVTAIIALP